MNNELNSLLKMTLNRWLNSNIIENFFLFEIYVKISNLTYEQDNYYNNLLKIIVSLEKDYTIPETAIEIKKWLKKNDYNRIIYDIYYKLIKLSRI